MKAPSSLTGQAALVASAFLVLEAAYVLAEGHTVLQSGLVNEVPQRQLALDQWRDGILPIWSSGLGTGLPLLADSTSLPLDPRNLLIMPFATLDGYLAAAILTRVAGGVIAFLYLRRRLGAPGLPAFIGAMLFGTSTIMFEEGTPLANGIVAFPAFVWLGERLLESVTAGRVLALGAAWGLFMFMHSVAYVPLMMGGALAWCLLYGFFCAHGGRAVARFAVGFAAAVAIGVGLAAVNLLPAAELISSSNRGGEYPTDPFAVNSVFTALVGVHQASDAITRDTYYLYVGVLALAPILVATRRWGNPYVRSAAVLALGTALLVLTGFLAKPLLVDLFPSLASFAFARPTFLVGFGAAVLVTLGLAERNWRLGRWAAAALAGLLAVQASFLAVEAAAGAAAIALLLTAVRAGGLGAALAGNRVAVGSLLLAELALAWAIARPLPEDGYEGSPELTFLKDRAEPDFRAMGITPRPEWTDGLPGPVGFSLHTNVPAYEGIATPNIYGSLLSSDYSETFDDFGDFEARLAAHGERAPRSRMETTQYDSPLLRAFGVRYLYSTSELPDPRASELALTGDGHYLYELDDPLPRAFFSGQAHWLPRDEVHEELGSLATNRLGSVTLGPEILLEGTERTEGRPAYAPAQVRSDRGSAVEVSVFAPAEGFLVLSDVDLPGWSATVDGEPAPIFKANGFAKAVRVPAGVHDVDFEYSPDGLRLGALISGGTAVLCAAVMLSSALGPRVRRHRISP